MTNPTRQEIIAAHNALGELSGLAEELAVTDLDSLQAREYYTSILRVLPPKPKPTMADVVWNNEKHFLAEAKIKNGPLVAMIGKDQEQWITCIPIGTDPSLLHKRTVFEGYLTPTGKRYTLTEVQE